MGKTFLLLCLTLSWSYNSDIQETDFAENIEYCQYVYMSGKNPLNETCDFEQVKKSLQYKF